MSDDEPVSIRIRPQLLRAFRWPWLLWRFHRCGLSWRAAWRQTHWVIWYPE